VASKIQRGGGIPRATCRPPRGPTSGRSALAPPPTGPGSSRTAPAPPKRRRPADELVHPPQLSSRLPPEVTDAAIRAAVDGAGRRRRSGESRGRVGRADPAV